MHNLFSRKIEPFRRVKTTYKLAKGCTSEKFSLKDILEPLKKPEQVEAMYGCIVRNKARNYLFQYVPAEHVGTERFEQQTNLTNIWF